MISKNELFNEMKISKKTIAITGDGVSALSGIPNLNNINFSGFPLNTIFTSKFYKSNPTIFYKVYSQILNLKNHMPNYIHKFLAGNNISIITENIDGLHNKAGSNDIIELYGNLDYLFCEGCLQTIKTENIKLNKVSESESVINRSFICKNCGTILRPNLVLFGEPVINITDAIQLIDVSDLILIIGNDLRIWPANQLAFKARKQGSRVLIINDNYKYLFN